MKGKKTVRSWYHLLPFVLSVFLLAGMFGLLAPADAYAAGQGITISGPGLNEPEGVAFTQDQLENDLPQTIEYYSTINTWPTKSWYGGVGVKLTDLLEAAGGLNEQATQIRIISADGFKATFTLQELLGETRYRFPNFMDTGLPGHLIGDASGAEPVEPIIAYKSGSGHTIADVMNDSNLKDGDANHLLYGQRAVTQQTNARFSKYVTAIEVLTEPAPQWDVPTASVAPGEVPVGTLVELKSKFNDEDKIHYTLDGSDPTIESPMYNWIASRWWSSRQDDLDDINRPIEITKDTTIKAIVIGPGRADSEIVEFTYTVEESATVAVTGVSISESDQELEEGQTVKLNAVVTPADATNKNVGWSSSNDAVATVSETGLVTAVAEGTATITVTTEDGEFTDSITVTVTAVPTSDFVVENGVLKEYKGAGGDVVIPGNLGITSIGYPSFYANSSITSVVIPEGVTTIGSSAFDNCTSLTSVVLPQSVTSIGASAFSECNILSEINIPEGVTNIGDEAFWRCYALENIILPNSLTNIGEAAFWQCTGLSEINIPESVTDIGPKAFQSCSKLTEIVIPNSVASIGDRAFYRCSALTSATILGTNTALGAELFDQYPAGTPRVVTIHGYRGSTAEAYATENSIPFEAIDATVAVTGVSITESDQELKVDETVQLNAVVEPANATNKNVTWSSSDESIATVDENGLVTAVAQGTVTITVTTEDGNFTDSITVNSVPVGPQILLRCNSGIPEANVFITGSGFDVGAVGTIWFDTNNNGVLDDGEPSVNVKTDADGAIPLLTSLTVPSVSTGNYTVQADVPSGDGIEAAAVFTVTDVGIIVGPISGNSQGQGDVRYITVTGSGFAPSTSYRLFCDRNGNGIFDDGAYKSGTTTADGTVSVNNMSWPASPTGIYNILLDINKDDTIEASASIAITPGIKISTPSGIPGANIGMTLVGFSANETGYVWFDTNGNEVWDEGENQLPVTTSNGGSVNTSGLIVPSVSPGNYQVCTAIPACGLKASATYTVTGLTLNPNSGTAGTSIDILGYGYVANQTSGKYIWFDTNGNGSWDADESKVDVTTDASGILSPVSLTVPAVPAGTYNVCASVFPSGTFAVFTVKDPPAIDILYDGTVTLNAGETFTVTVDANEYIINENTPLGALHKASIASGFSYAVTDKKYQNSGILLLDDIGSYPYVKSGSEWYAYVNDVYKDGYENSNNALNLVELVDGDKVEFYYADIDSTDLNAVKTAATAAVLIVVDSDATTPSDWTLQLSGAKEETVTKAYFEQGLACASSSHQVSWTDGDGNTWGGVPLWLLVAMVDDDPDAGDKHINFNDELAVQDYEIKVIAGDGWSTTLSSAAIARSDAYIVANTLNGEPLPLKTESGKDCWPLYLKGSAISGGQQVGNIVRIELSGLPEPTAGWTLEMIGEVGDTITQEEFEDGLACTGSGHYQEWKDKDGNLWSGVPLWVLLGAVDDIETGAHWTFNNELASSYSVKVIAGDGNYFKTFAGSDVAESNDYIVANKCNGEALTGSSAPLRLVGDGVTKDDGSLGGLAVGNIARIEIPELQTPAAEPGSWNLALNGKISDVISQTEFEAGLVCPNSGHLKQWKDADGNVWSGIPLWLLAGWVDDRKPHSYDYNQAVIGYKVLVKAGDGYSVDFASAEINKSSDYIIANKFNGVPLTDSGPLRLVGTGVAKDDGSLSGKSVGNIVEIELTSFATGGGGIIPELRIVKYAEDGTTILAEETLNYIDMKDRFKVIGDGTTVYKFQGITNDPENIWDPEETNLGGFKIANAVMGTRLKDLCELVGGMGAGTEIVLAANDGYETKLPYSSIYTDPSVQARQGDAILAWYADGKYVPEYRDGMRLFFTPEDTVYSQWDMHETLPEPYWHYYGAEGVMYPSCAGLSAKYITEIKVYSVPQGDWTLELDGQDIGGLKTDISKTYFESALTCQFGANHKATYTDSKERTWEGMPLWFLVGFVDDADQHSNNAYNDALAESGYQVVITAEDGYSVTIDSTDLGRNNNYIIANSLNGATIPETDENWPLRLVGPAVTGTNSISQIVSIKLVSSEQVDPVYTVSPVADAAYTAGTNPDGINTMTVNTGVSGFKYFTVDIEPVASHSGDETVVFTHLRNGIQLQINSTRADFDEVDIAQAGFNVQSGDVIKVYIVDELTNATDHNPVILQ